jgi:hypothetical protein
MAIPWRLAMCTRGRPNNSNQIGNSNWKRKYFRDDVIRYGIRRMNVYYIDGQILEWGTQASDSLCYSAVTALRLFQMSSATRAITLRVLLLYNIYRSIKLAIRHSWLTPVCWYKSTAVVVSIIYSSCAQVYIQCSTIDLITNSPTCVCCLFPVIIFLSANGGSPTVHTSSTIACGYSYTLKTIHIRTWGVASLYNHRSWRSW